MQLQIIQNVTLSLLGFVSCRKAYIQIMEWIHGSDGHNNADNSFVD